MSVLKPKGAIYYLLIVSIFLSYLCICRAHKRADSSSIFGINNYDLIINVKKFLVLTSNPETHVALSMTHGAVTTAQLYVPSNFS